MSGDSTDDMRRREFLFAATGAAVAGSFLGTAGCSFGTAVATDATPLIGKLLESVISSYGASTGTFLANSSQKGINNIVGALRGELYKYFKNDENKTADADPVFGYGTTPGSPMTFVTALWRTKDHKPATRTRVHVRDAASTFDIPTPAHLAITLMAEQYVKQLTAELEKDGLCVSTNELKQKAMQLFLPGKSSEIQTPTLQIEHISEPCTYTYWTAGNASIEVDWRPAFDRKNKTKTILAANYNPGSGYTGYAPELTVSPVHQPYEFGQIWKRSTENSIQLNPPPRNVPYTSQNRRPTAVGSIAGNWSHRDEGGKRTVTGEGFYTNRGSNGDGLPGRLFLNLSGAPSGDYWVKHADGLPMTFTYIPGDCAIYSGDVTIGGSRKAAPGIPDGGTINADLSGPGGAVKVTLLFSKTDSKTFHGTLNME